MNAALRIQLTGFDAFSSLLTDVQQRQLPFATANALNRTMDEVQTAQRQHDAQVFTLRQKQWADFSIKRTREDFASKTQLSASVRLQPPSRRGRDPVDILGKFEIGGTKSPIAGGRDIAIPADVRTSPSELIANSLRPRALLKKKDVFIVRAGDRAAAWLAPGLYERVGPGRVKLLYFFEPSVKIDDRLRFFETARSTIDARWPINFDAFMARALAGAR